MNVFKELDGAGFAFRGDHRIASIRMQAKSNYSMDPCPDMDIDGNW
jgi:hypothetical protein